MITGPSPAAAARELRAVLQGAIACVSMGVLVDDRSAVANELRLVTQLRRTAQSEHIALTIGHRYGVIADLDRDARRRWQARTLGYLYALDDADGREILAYHWHPAGRSHMTTPHLHLGAGIGRLRPEMTKAHLATGAVTPAALLTLIIEKFGVRPRRADWASVLDRARQRLELSHG